VTGGAPAPVRRNALPEIRMPRLCFAVPLLVFASLACHGPKGDAPRTSAADAEVASGVEIRGIDQQGIDIRPARRLRVRYERLDEALHGVGALAIDVQNFSPKPISASIGAVKATVPAANGDQPGATRLTFHVAEGDVQRVVVVESGGARDRVRPTGEFLRSKRVVAPVLAPKSRADAPDELLVDVQGLKVVWRLEEAP